VSAAEGRRGVGPLSADFRLQIADLKSQ